MKKRILSLLLAAALAFSCLALPAFAEEAADSQPETAAEDHSFTYVALGDSITAGVGLNDLKYLPAEVGFDFAPNFEGYPSQCYVAKVAEGLGLDRQHAINLGLPSLMSGDMLDLIRTGAMPQINQPAWTHYVYPQYQDYIREADLITIQIGSNDALVPCIVALGNATNWKSELLADSLVSGLLRNLNLESLDLLFDGLSRLKLTREEKAATRQLLFHNMGDICQQAYNDVTSNLPQIVQAIRELNPDAQIVLMGYTNPVPLLSVWTKYFNQLNSFEKQLAKEQGLTYVAIPNTSTAADGHPTVAGHRYISRQLLRALKKK